MEAVAATVPGCEAGKCSVPGVPGTGPDFGNFPESISPAAIGSDLPEELTGTGTTARGAWALWRLAGRILAGMAHTKGWGAFAALRSDGRSVQVAICP